MRRLSSLALSLLLLGSGPHPSSSPELRGGLCPATLAGQGGAADPKGFIFYSDGNPPGRLPTIAQSSARLTAVRFSDGDPAEIAWLVPSTSSRKLQTWDFRKSGVTHAFITCVYGDASVFLARELPAEQLCRVDYAKGYVPLRASCS